MATTRTYDAATGLALGGHAATSEHENRPQLGNPRAALDRAAQIYANAVYQTRTATAAAFFVATAIAVGAQSSAPLPLLGMVALTLLSALSSTPLARYRFREEIVRFARREGLSESDARQLAGTMLSEWSASIKKTPF